jgi:hypothetical protein
MGLIVLARTGNLSGLELDGKGHLQLADLSDHLGGIGQGGYVVAAAKLASCVESAQIIAERLGYGRDVVVLDDLNLERPKAWNAHYTKAIDVLIDAFEHHRGPGGIIVVTPKIVVDRAPERLANKCCWPENPEQYDSRFGEAAMMDMLAKKSELYPRKN